LTRGKNLKNQTDEKKKTRTPKERERGLTRQKKTRHRKKKKGLPFIEKHSKGPGGRLKRRRRKGGPGLLAQKKPPRKEAISREEARKKNVDQRTLLRAKRRGQK